MTTFDQREEAFERKFAHDEEMLFRAVARRNKLVGLWAAEKLGKTGEEAHAYAREVVLATSQKGGEAEVVRKLGADLAGTGTGDAEVRAAMDRFLAQAKQDVAAGR